LIEVIDLGNQLVYKEYQKMGNETNVNDPILSDIFRFTKEKLSRRIS